MFLAIYLAVEKIIGLKLNLSDFAVKLNILEIYCKEILILLNIWCLHVFINMWRSRHPVASGKH